MFALGSNSRQRSQSQSHLNPSYHFQEHYLPTHLSQDSNPRPFAGERSRADLYLHPSENSPHECSIDGSPEYLSPTATFIQSYDRHASSSSVSPHTPYHNSHQHPGSDRLDYAGPAHLKRIPTPNISLALHQPFSSGQSSIPIPSASQHPGDLEFGPGNAQTPFLEHSKPRKPRREKPRIELAPDQPPTTQGKPRARVYVACLQWFILSISRIYHHSWLSKF